MERHATRPATENGMLTSVLGLTDDDLIQLVDFASHMLGTEPSSSRATATFWFELLGLLDGERVRRRQEILALEHLYFQS